jgi:hypothetical protein
MLLKITICTVHGYALPQKISPPNSHFYTP